MAHSFFCGGGEGETKKKNLHANMVTFVMSEIEIVIAEAVWGPVRNLFFLFCVRVYVCVSGCF